MRARIAATEAVPDQIALTGPRPRLDARVHLARPDLADIALAGMVAANRYVMPAHRRCAVPGVAMRKAGDPDAVAVSELIWGETFALLDIANGWGLGRTLHDDYLGWVPLTALADADAGPAPWQVTTRAALVFAAPDIKAPVQAVLPFGARLAGTLTDRFLALADGGHVHRRHVEAMPADRFAAAALFLGAPYLWGGRTPAGVDCSGLVQAALAVEGHTLCRDSDQQLASDGVAVPFAARARGDLVYFPGHVGLLTAPDRLLHANAHWMATVEEPLQDVIDRLHAAGVAQPVTGVKRFVSASA